MAIFNNNQLSGAPVLNCRSALSIMVLFFVLSCSNGAHSFDASGHFEATEVTVSAQMTGQILSLQAEQGDVVTEGQLLALVDTLPLSIQKRQVESKIKAVEGKRIDVESRVAPIRQQIKKQKSEQIRLSKLIEANAAPAKQLEDVESHIALLNDQLVAELTAIESANRGITLEINAMKVELESIADMLNRCRIESPIGGVILEKYVEDGELAVAARPMYKVADISKMYLKAYITSNQLSTVKLGDKVKVYSDFGEERREYSGSIVNIATQSEFTPKSVYTKDERANLVYGVKIAVESDGYLKIGMYGEVEFK